MMEGVAGGSGDKKGGGGGVMGGEPVSWHSIITRTFADVALSASRILT